MKMFYTTKKCFIQLNKGNNFNLTQTLKLKFEYEKFYKYEFCKFLLN